MNERERSVMRRVIMDSYEQFLTHVLENRPELGRGRLENLADGRVLTGRQAQENKLVDRLGTRREALETLRDAAGVDDSARIWNPSENRFGLGRIGQRIASRVDQWLSPSDFGFRLLYMMSDWRSAVD